MWRHGRCVAVCNSNVCVSYPPAVPRRQLKTEQVAKKFSLVSTKMVMCIVVTLLLLPRQLPVNMLNLNLSGEPVTLQTLFAPRSILFSNQKG